MAGRIRWGILDAGGVSAKFAEALREIPGAELRAVGSRARATAETFGDRFGIPVRYGSYEDLAGDPSADVTYVGTPHSCHYRDTVIGLQAGKSVLVEKPFMLNADQAKRVVARARDKHLFLTEAMWTRFVPCMERLQELLRSGGIGSPHLLTAAPGIWRSRESRPRLFDARLGGSALLDTGVYPVSLSSLLLGSPERIVSLSHVGSYGVDERAAMLMELRGEALAILYCAMQSETPKEAIFMDELGRIRLHNLAHPARLTITLNEGEDQVEEFPVEGKGLHCEALEVMRCLCHGLSESPRMCLGDSVSIMRTWTQFANRGGSSTLESPSRVLKNCRRMFR